MVRKLHFPYDEVNIRILVFFFRSASSNIIFLANSIFVLFLFFLFVFFGNDIFL